jgi:uncharacterized protein YbbK (DUF523 family)
MKQRLPARPDLEWLKRAAKNRLAALRVDEPGARLFQAQLDVARDHGYPSWRALKAYVQGLGPVLSPTARPAHLPRLESIDAWPEFTPDRPLKLLVSGCLAGLPVLANGTAYDLRPTKRTLMAMPNVDAIHFCPEDFAFGTPRAIPDIHGGTGVDVLDGRARVIASNGEDWTDGMVGAAHEMLRRAQAHGARLALLSDISAACGSQVIYRGARENAPHQIGQGVCAALLVRNGVLVVSQRDFKTLGRIVRKLDPSYRGADDLRDHHEIEWYRQYFGEPAPSAGA